MSSQDSENDKGKVKATARMNIKVSDEHARGSYANVAIIHNNDVEFVFDFVFIEPQRGQGHVVSRVVTNPRTAKRLLSGLTELVRTHEERFGPIKMPERAPPKGHYH
jgi:hypothetical protein